MSRRLSVQLKNISGQKSSKPKVKFPDELVFLDSVKDNDVEEVRLMLRRASANIDINKMNTSGKFKKSSKSSFLFTVFEFFISIKQDYAHYIKLA